MSWKVVTVTDQRELFMSILEGEESPGVAALCREFGVSRKTGYKWITRYKAQGREGLADLSRASLTHANAIGEEMEELVILARQAHPSWGAKKLLPWLRRKHPVRDDWPCLSSVSAILDRNQLVRSRKTRRPVPPFAGDLTQAAQPNDVWCIDHKGWWLAGNGEKCEPFTITDDASRYLIRCALDRGKGIDFVRPILTAAFIEYGLPAFMRSDNGPPFASRAPLGLSELTVWLMRLGVGHERIEPGKPQQNGRHERMHLSMLLDRSGPILRSRRLEQKRLNIWREEFNTERPHEALDFQTPGSCYSASPRPMPRRLPEFEYASGIHVRKVDKTGKIAWKGQDLFLTEALRKQWLGFEAIDNGIWKIRLAKIQIGVFDEKRHEMQWADRLAETD